MKSDTISTQAAEINSWRRLRKERVIDTRKTHGNERADLGFLEPKHKQSTYISGQTCQEHTDYEEPEKHNMLSWMNWKCTLWRLNKDKTWNLHFAGHPVWRRMMQRFFSKEAMRKDKTRERNISTFNGQSCITQSKGAHNPLHHRSSLWCSGSSQNRRSAAPLALEYSHLYSRSQWPCILSALFKYEFARAIAYELMPFLSSTICCATWHNDGYLPYYKTVAFTLWKAPATSRGYPKCIKTTPITPNPHFASFFFFFFNQPP